MCPEVQIAPFDVTCSFFANYLFVLRQQLLVRLPVVSVEAAHTTTLMFLEQRTTILVSAPPVLKGDDLLARAIKRVT